MAILNCQCGQVFRVEDNMIGRKVNCPKCATAMWVPVPAAEPKPVRQGGVVFEKGWFGSMNSGVAGGLLMIVIAAVWFVAGLTLMNRIFFYPPILLIIGVISLVKGIFGD